MSGPPVLFDASVMASNVDLCIATSSAVTVSRPGALFKYESTDTRTSNWETAQLWRAVRDGVYCIDPDLLSYSEVSIVARRLHTLLFKGRGSSTVENRKVYCMSRVIADMYFTPSQHHEVRVLQFYFDHCHYCPCSIVASSIIE